MNISAGYQFEEPAENHSAPIAPRAKEPERERERGFTDKALDAYTIQDLLDLRARVERRLPAKSLKDLNLERELTLQFLALQQLQNRVIDDDDASPSHRAQVANSLSAALANLVKIESAVYTSTRLKQIEAALIDTLNDMPTEAAEQFLSRYEAELLTRGLDKD